MFDVHVEYHEEYLSMTSHNVSVIVYFEQKDTSTMSVELQSQQSVDRYRKHHKVLTN